jgi:hypothetical protein
MYAELLIISCAIQEFACCNRWRNLAVTALIVSGYDNDMCSVPTSESKCCYGVLPEGTDSILAYRHTVPVSYSIANWLFGCVHVDTKIANRSLE